MTTVIDEPCIICHAPGPSQTCHWPYSRRYGDAVVPMCAQHHSDQHWGKRDVIEKLIARAPGYWRRVGEWEANIDAYDRWCSKRRYQQDVQWVH